MTRAAALVAALSVAACADAPGVVVFAAASAVDVAEEAAARASTDAEPAVVSAGASSTLARQIAAGAPADVFVSADGAWIDWLESEGVDVRDRAVLASGRLVVVAREGEPATTLGEALGGAGRIALGDPGHVPAGVYARDALRRAGLWEVVRDRVVPQADARAALAAVETGAADVAVVYASDARASRRVRVVFQVDADVAPPVRYEAALVGSGTGRRVFDALRGADLWERRGFEPARDP